MSLARFLSNPREKDNAEKSNAVEHAILNTVSRLLIRQCVMLLKDNAKSDLNE